MKNKKITLIFAAVLAGLAALAYFVGPRYFPGSQSPESMSATESSAGVEQVAGGNPTPTNDNAGTASTGAPGGSTMSADFKPDFTADEQGLSKTVVSMQTTKGLIRYRFYAGDAPKTSARIAELIQKGFYNGLTFHRVVPGFVIQGGDPQGTGMGGSGQRLPAEFNTRKHVPGTVAMARSSDPNSADSQFYIALGTLPDLDRKYTVFGQVIEGQDVVKQIQVGDKMLSVTMDN